MADLKRLGLSNGESICHWEGIKKGEEDSDQSRTDQFKIAACKVPDFRLGKRMKEQVNRKG